MDEVVDMPTNRPRVMLVEDNQYMVAGLKAILADRMDVIGVAGSVEEAVDAVRRLRPDLGLVDLRIPRRPGDGDRDPRHGLEVIRSIRTLSPSTRVLVLSDVYNDPSPDRTRLVAEAFRAGAEGGLAKLDQRGGNELLNDIDRFLAGQPLFSPAVAKVVLEGFVESASSVALTPKEERALRDLVDGKNVQLDAEISGAIDKSRQLPAFYPTGAFHSPKQDQPERAD